MIKSQLGLKSLGSFKASLSLFFWNGLSLLETHTEHESSSKKVGNKWAITLEDRNISSEGKSKRENVYIMTKHLKKGKGKIFLKSLQSV